MEVYFHLNKANNSDAHFLHEIKHFHHLTTLAHRNTQILEMSHLFESYISY